MASPSPPAGFDRLPVELIWAITEHLNLRDAAAFDKALHASSIHASSATYRYRSDPVRYLGHAFPKSLSLLATMADTVSVLGGSRAVEYFIPNSTDLRSGWDFFVSDRNHAIMAMIHALQCNGVEWDDQLRAATHAYENPGTPAVHVHGSILLGWIKAKCHCVQDRSPSEARFLEAVAADTGGIEDGASLFEEFVVGDIDAVKKLDLFGAYRRHRSDSRIILTHDWAIGTGDAFDRLAGTVWVAGRAQKVNLYVCRKGHHAATGPMRSGTTLQQCFLAGVGAVHAHAPLSFARQSYEYDDNRHGDVYNYMSRGFDVGIPYPMMETQRLRSVMDATSYWKDFRHIYAHEGLSRRQRSILEDYALSLQGMAWLQTGEENSIQLRSVYPLLEFTARPSPEGTPT